MWLRTTSLNLGKSQVQEASHFKDPTPQNESYPRVFIWFSLNSTGKGRRWCIVFGSNTLYKTLLTFSDPITAQLQGRAVLELSLHAVSNENRGECGKVNVDVGNSRYSFFGLPSVSFQEITFCI